MLAFFFFSIQRRHEYMQVKEKPHSPPALPSPTPAKVSSLATPVYLNLGTGIYTGSVPGPALSFGIKDT